jgi:hypothetical protein
MHKKTLGLIIFNANLSEKDQTGSQAEYVFGKPFNIRAHIHIMHREKNEKRLRTLHSNLVQREI